MPSTPGGAGGRLRRDGQPGDPHRHPGAGSWRPSNRMRCCASATARARCYPPNSCRAAGVCSPNCPTTCCNGSTSKAPATTNSTPPIAGSPRRVRRVPPRTQRCAQGRFRGQRRTDRGGHRRVRRHHSQPRRDGRSARSRSRYPSRAAPQLYGARPHELAPRGRQVSADAPAAQQLHEAGHHGRQRETEQHGFAWCFNWPNELKCWARSDTK